MKNRTIKLGKYRHCKGKDYEVLGVARHSETLEELVVYRALHGSHDIWVRPLPMFFEKVEIGGKKVARFSYIEIKKSRRVRTRRARVRSALLEVSQFSPPRTPRRVFHS